MNREWQDKIDDYLLGRMPEKERLAFKEQIDTNHDLREQLLFTQNVLKAIKSRNEKLESLKEWQDDYKWRSNTEDISKEIKTANRGFKTFLYWTASIAAMLFVGLFIFQKQNEATYNFDNITFPMINDTFRGHSEYSNIELLLNQKDYDEALKLINEELRVLYKDSFDVVTRDLRAELLWLKMQVLVGLNRDKEAVEILKSLRNMGGRYQLAADSIYNIIIIK